jgi:hypothetical protein
LFKCSFPGLSEFGVATYTPGLFTGVGMVCTEIDDGNAGDVLRINGKTLIKALELIRKLPF